jgi:hypothetical protein
VEYLEQTEEESRQHELAAAAVRHHHGLVALAAARTRQAADEMVNSSRQHQRARMLPLVLKVGARCRISYLFTPSVRQQVKVSYVKSFAPSYTREVYSITHRALAPGSRRVVVYTLEAEDEALEEGQQGGSRINQIIVRIPLRVTNCDRRYLQPLPADGAAPALGRRFPDSRYAFAILEGARHAKPGGDDEDVGDLYDDIESAVS